MDDSRKYVFDWHATLDLENPLIYASEIDFRNKGTEVDFKDFEGFGEP
jgi:hypothetical protein